MSVVKTWKNILEPRKFLIQNILWIEHSYDVAYGLEPYFIALRSSDEIGNIYAVGNKDIFSNLSGGTLPFKL